MLASGNPIKDVDQLGYISRQLFGMDKNEVKFPVQFSKGIAIVQLTKIEEPQVQPFENVIADVKAEVVTKRKMDQLMEDAKKFAEELNKIDDDKKREEFVKKNDLTVDSVTYNLGGKLSYLENREGLDDMIFSAPENQYSEPLRYDSDIAFFKVKSKTVTTDADFEKEKDEFYQEKVEEMKNNYFFSYMATRQDKFEVKTNMDLYEKIKTDVLARFN
jgi:hypothetical protein